MSTASFLRHAALAASLAFSTLPSVNAAEGITLTRLEPQRSFGSGALRPNLHCFGALQPTVIFDVSGEPLSLWTRVVPLLKERSRTCIWNQGAPLTPEQDAQALHAALAASGETSPYLHVSQGRSSANAVAFAQRYLRELAGLALVDGAPLPAGAVPDSELPIAVLSASQPEDSEWQDSQAALAAMTTQTMQLLAPVARGSLPQLAPDVVAIGLDWLLRFARTEATAIDYPAGH